MGRLVILTGPSCVGKTPLRAALYRHYPHIAEQMQFLVASTSRAPRPGEKDGVHYHFRTKSEIRSLGDRDGILIQASRGDMLALDTNQIKSIIGAGKDALYEGNFDLALQLMQTTGYGDHARLAIFISPLSKDEIQALKDPGLHLNLDSVIPEIMRRKLLRRAKKQRGLLSLPELKNIERRAEHAYACMKEAWRFSHVIVNHDGEDSEHWHAFPYPLGDARKALLTLVALLQSETDHNAETWDRNVLSEG